MEFAEDIVIVGAGLAGLATSLGLYRLGIKSLVLESSARLRLAEFALTTWTNAWKVIDALGIGDSLRKHHMLIDGCVLCSGEHELRCQKRKTLLQTLANELPPDTIKFSSKMVSIEESSYCKLVYLADGMIIKAKVLIGCDGVNSVVGKWLGFKRPSLTGRIAIRGMANFKGGQGYGTKFQQVFGNGLRSGFLPCDDTSIYWFFTWTPSTPNEMTLDKMKETVLSKLENGVNPLLKTVIETLKYPLELLWGNISKGNVCVAGDALHPMTPDIGQGGCSSLEDGLVLARCLAEALSISIVKF
ncbi:monoxygenase, putative [Ricinus communis]|uniref:Monoxygenase, putative n=1 Tax=Ricinus communis TaxID=3988 RepID=B9S5L0_RICCO|nr:monoxygenase, putative [Ricinus communis]